MYVPRLGNQHKFSARIAAFKYRTNIEPRSMKKILCSANLKYCHFLVAALCVIAAACSPPPDRARQDSTTTPAKSSSPNISTNAASKSEHFRKQIPTEIQSASRSTGGLCPVDSINLQLASAAGKSIRILKSNPFAAEGWAVTESADKPVPDLIFLVLTADGVDYFLPGTRTERADVAKGDPKLRFVGFKAAGFIGDVPPTKYRLRIASSDASKLTLCDSGYEIIVE